MESLNIGSHEKKFSKAIRFCCGKVSRFISHIEIHVAQSRVTVANQIVYTAIAT